MKKRTIVIGVSIYAAIVALAFYLTLREDPAEAALAHLAAGEYAEAAADFTEVLEADPDDVDAYLGRAEALRHDDPEGALPDLDAAIERLRGTDDSRLMRALAHRGAIWWGLDDLERAVRDYEDAAKLPGAGFEVFLGLALVRAHGGDPQVTLEAVEEALRLAPTSLPKEIEVLLVRTRGMARWDTGDRDGGLADLDRAVDLDPAADSYLVRATRYGILGRYDAAHSDVAEALRAEPGHQRARAYRGWLLNRQGEHARAKAVWAELAAEFPEDPQMVNQLAWLLATCPDGSVRDGARAVALSRRAAEASGMKDAPILDTVAAAYAEAGQFDEAVSWQQKALDRLTEERHRDGMIERLELYRSGTPYREQ